MFRESKFWYNLIFYCLLYYSILLPWQVQWLPATLAMMVGGLFWLLAFDFKAKIQRLSSNSLASFMFVSYLLVIAGAVYSPESKEAGKEVFSKLPLLVWPLLLGSMPGLTKSRVGSLLKVFVSSTALAMFTAFGYGLYRYWEGGLSYVFYFNDLLSLVKVPAHYMGMYITFAYALVLQRWASGRPLYSSRWLNLAVLVFFAFSLVFIWVRMQYLLFFFVNALIAISYLKNKFGYRKASLYFGLYSVGFALLLVLIPGSRKRLVDTYNEMRSFNQMIDNKQTNPRKFLWTEGAGLISENLWWGMGTGAENTALNERLEKVDAIFWDGKSTYQLYEMGFNYHNSYLQVFAANGIWAFLCFLALLFYPFFKLKHHPYRQEARIFLFIIILSFLTESMLQRQAGVLFFTFFYALLLVMPTLGYGKKEA